MSYSDIYSHFEFTRRITKKKAHIHKESEQLCRHLWGGRAEGECPDLQTGKQFSIERNTAEAASEGGKLCFFGFNWACGTWRISHHALWCSSDQMNRSLLAFLHCHELFSFTVPPLYLSPHCRRVFNLCDWRRLHTRFYRRVHVFHLKVSWLGSVAFTDTSKDTWGCREINSCCVTTSAFVLLTMAQICVNVLYMYIYNYLFNFGTFSPPYYQCLFLNFFNLLFHSFIAPVTNK